MFPKLDGDLGSVGNHFTFDNLVTANSTQSICSNELKTPQQNDERKDFGIIDIQETQDDQTVKVKCNIQDKQFK